MLHCKDAWKHGVSLRCKIEKVPKDIQRENSRKDKVREILSQELEHKQVPKRGHIQVSGMVSVPCWHATPIANALWKTSRNSVMVKLGTKVMKWSKVLSVGKSR